MGSSVGELTRPHKGTLFNLLHIKGRAPRSEQAQTAVGTAPSLPLWRDSAQWCPQPRTGSRRPLNASESISQAAVMTIRRALRSRRSPWSVHKGLFSTIKGVTLLHGRFEMLILFSIAFWSHFQHEIPQRWWLKKVTIASTFNQNWSLSSFIKPIRITALFQMSHFIRLSCICDLINWGLLLCGGPA